MRPEMNKIQQQQLQSTDRIVLILEYPTTSNNGMLIVHLIFVTLYVVVDDRYFILLIIRTYSFNSAFNIRDTVCCCR